MNARNLFDDVSELSFEDQFCRALPGDPEERNFPRQVPGAAWSAVKPTSVRAPRVLAYSPEVLRDLGLSEAAVGRPSFAEVLGGNRLIPGMRPYAARYAGHQFGNWAGQLGDGRAMTLGEVMTPEGSLELQLKGAGPTPYARGADGRAVLRSSLREFLCSEAMFHLGIPTTRALSLVTTGENVLRDMFYDGHPEEEPGAIVARVAPSFLRFGSFQVHAAFGEPALLRALFEFAARRHDLGEGEGEARVVSFYAEVVRRTLDLVDHWRRVGFVHGVMNTDNLSILGLTIDYGPYGWLEAYDQDWTPNTTDASRRRYRFGQQERVAVWNLARLAEALAPLIGRLEPLEEILVSAFEGIERRILEVWARKLGFASLQPEDHATIADLESILAEQETDYILFFRGLADVPLDPDAPEATRLDPIRPALYGGVSPRLSDWIRRWRVRVGGDPGIRSAMNAVNPRMVLRNWIAVEVTEAVVAGDSRPLERLFQALKDPYSDTASHEDWVRRRPEWARNRAGCSMLSCSS